MLEKIRHGLKNAMLRRAKQDVVSRVCIMERGAAMNATALQPFLTTALPIMVTILLAVWMNGKGFNGVHKRLDDTNRRFDTLFDEGNRRFDKVDARLERIEAKLENHESRIVRLEERTSPLAGVR